MASRNGGTYFQGFLRNLLSNPRLIGELGSYSLRFFRERVRELGRGIQPAPFRPEPRTWNDNGITAAWLGHSTVLLNFYGVNILTDPALFPRIGADLRLGVVGPRRLTHSALKLAELPPIDLVLLSHAHMDHTDWHTLRQIPYSTRVICARGNRDLVAGKRFVSTEMGWNDRCTVQTRNGPVQVEAFEVCHWGSRWRVDTHRGYNGYIIQREGKRILFGGDTAFCGHFRNLRAKGPFALACMPIGAYDPWRHAHCTPEEAVQMASEAGSELILPMHHQTFLLSREPVREPIERFQEALGKEPERIAVREIGETFFLHD